MGGPYWKYDFLWACYKYLWFTIESQTGNALVEVTKMETDSFHVDVDFSIYFERL